MRLKLTRMIDLVDYGGGNLGSVERALQRLDQPYRLTTQPGGNNRIILPGVGSFGAVMHSLKSLRLDQRLKDLIQQKTPFLGICVGLQILLEESEESPGVPGLALIPGKVVRFQAPKVPQIGWNRIQGGFVYFVNSYYARLQNPEHLWYEADYHGPFCAALKYENISAFQFHPEKSGEFGQKLLLDWIRPSHRRLCRRIIPCLDVANGRTVKGIKFQNLRDVGDPIQLGRAYQQQGADELMFLDISASHQRRTTMLDWVRGVAAELSIPFAVGGGVNSLDGVLELLRCGADKVSLNTAAVEQPELLTAIANRCGSQCCVVAIDARKKGDSWEVLIHGGRTQTGLDALQWGKEVAERGAGEILLTSWDQDGTRSGFDLELTRAFARALTIPVIASGGAKGPESFADVFEKGEADAALAASIFHDGEWTVGALKQAILQLSPSLPLRYPC